MPLDYARIPTEARVWIMQRPPAVRAVIERYPPGVYDVRAGAPYSLTGPGTRVVLVAYTEDEGDGGGEQVKVQVLDSTAAADAKARERSGGRVATAAGTTALVDPRWLELVEVSPILKPAWTPPAPEGEDSHEPR